MRFRFLACCRVIVGLLAMGGLSVQAADLDPLYQPEAVPVPLGKSTEQLRQVIHKVTKDKHWEVRDVGTGHIEARYFKKSRRNQVTSAVVDFHFDSRAIRIRYRESEGLDHNPKDGTISSTYNQWVRTFEKRLRKALNSY
jgi:hypothetical protein